MTLPKDTICCASGDGTQLSAWGNYDIVVIKCENEDGYVHGQFTPDDAYAFALALIDMANIAYLEKDL